MRTEIGHSIERAIFHLSEGNVIGIPTETVYGLAGDATQSDAISKIFHVKQRPATNPLILHFHSVEAIQDYILEFPQEAKAIAKHFWPGPLTMLLKKSNKVLPEITAGKEHVAIRIPNHPLILELLQKFDKPLAAPSANLYTQISPTTAQHVNKQLGQKIPYILDGGPCKAGLESTIIGFENNDICLYRLGSITVNQLEQITEKKIISKIASQSNLAPGMQKKHYSPTTPTFAFHKQEELPISEKPIGVISFQDAIKASPITNIILSKDGNYQEAAQSFYAALHQLDEKNLNAIYIQWAPDEDLGRTINDKVRRAVYK